MDINVDRNLWALMTPEVESGNYQCLPMFSHGTPKSPLEILASQGTVVFLDAKKDLEKLGHPQINAQIICLKTLKRLISHDHQAQVVEPLMRDDTTRFFETALHAALEKIAQNHLESLAKLECDIIKVTLTMQSRGLPFDVALWQEHLANVYKLHAAIKSQLLQLLKKEEGFELFGPESVDLNNTAEVKKAMERTLGISLRGTSQSDLQSIDHEASRLLIKFRELQRMLSTYGDHFIEKVTKNRIHANFIPLGSASGRFACTDPNLMALPSAPEFQACIKATSPYCLTSFDYGAFELRILAALSNDKKLAEIFNDDRDIHAMVAQEIFQTKVSKTENAHLRDQAKLINFGIIYGMGEAALAKKLSISQGRAKDLLDSYFTRFSSVKDFLYTLETQAQERGYVNTALGRKLVFTKTAHTDESYSLRVARNMPIQGTGADIMKLAMCKIFHAFNAKKCDAHVVNMIHDELIIECLDRERAEIISLTEAAMADAFSAVLPTIKASVSHETL